MQLTLALAQLATKLGDVQPNRDKHLDFIQRARSEKADLVPTVAHCSTDDDPVFGQLLKASKDLDIMVGFVDEDLHHRVCYIQPRSGRRDCPVEIRTGFPYTIRGVARATVERRRAPHSGGSRERVSLFCHFPGR